MPTKPLMILFQTQMLPYQVFSPTQAGEVRRALSSHSRPFRPIFKLVE